MPTATTNARRVEAAGDDVLLEGEAWKQSFLPVRAKEVRSGPGRTADARSHGLFPCPLACLVPKHRIV